MREHLFKGKRISDNEWTFGGISYAKDGAVFIVTTAKDNLGYITLMEQVYPETVCEYTGLCDKNGNKIFEGDIIKDLGGSMDSIPRVVFWNEVWMEFETYLAKSHWAYGTNQSRLWCMRRKEIEIIGNKIDNPELLEEEQ